MAFWRIFPQSDFKKKPTGKSTGGRTGSIGGLQDDAESSFQGFEAMRVGGKGR